jgi:3-phenylpropionate/trans-cinnamate dioxygenase ferredoxin reductase subunit
MSDTIDYLLVGGGLAHAQAARTIREARAGGRVVIVTSEPELPYNRPPLSKGYLQGRESRESTWVKPQKFWNDQKIEIITGRTVSGIDRQAHAVTFDDGSVMRYGKLSLALGGEPRKLDVPGAGLARVYYLRTIADAAALRAAAASAKRIVVVGAGFIGTEVAASLALGGADVTMLVAGEVILARQTGPMAGKYLMKYCEARGVKFLSDAAVDSFIGTKQLAGVKLRNGHEVEGDLAVVGVGVAPRTTLAEEAGLGMSNGVLVDAYLRTSDPDIYAAGDIANFMDEGYGHRFRIEHWDHAKATGKTVGVNMAGGAEKFDHLPYFFSDLFDLGLEAWGDMYQTDDVIERPARGGGHPAWFYLYRGRLCAAVLINGDKTEQQALQELLKQKPEFTGDVKRQMMLDR